MNITADKNTHNIWVASNFMIGFWTGLTSSLFAHPFNYAKIAIRHAAYEQGYEYKGFLNVLKKMKKSEGICGFYKGLTIASLYSCIYRCLYFGLFDSLNPILPESVQKDLLINFFLGWAVTLVADLVSFPIGIIRQRVNFGFGKYKGSIDCAKKILNEEGLLAFFKGANATRVKVMAGAGTLAFYGRLKIFHTELF